MAEIFEIVSKEQVDEIIRAAKSVVDLDNAILKVNADVSRLQKSFDANAKSTAEAGEKVKENTKIIDESVKQQQQLESIQRKMAVVNSDLNKQLIQQKTAYQEANKAIKDKLKQEEAGEKSLVRMRARLKELTEAYDKSNVRTKEAAKEIFKLSKEIQGAENSTNRFQRGVGDYKQGILELGKAFLTGQIGTKGLILGIRGIGAAIMSIPIIGWIAAVVAGFLAIGKAAIKNAQEFQTASSSLKAITGASDDQMNMMRRQARAYSKETGQSAASILTAFEKVGSAIPALLTMPELLTTVTRDAITLSQSTGGKLSVEDAAKAAASALNQFGLPLTESAKAINILAAGSQAGSAEVTDLAESFKNVGAVASGAGMTLEQTVAALETLGEKSLYGTEAGTKLRGSILKLQDAGLGYASGSFNFRDALMEANAKIDAQTTALEKDALAQKFFGAENITAGKILLDNVDKYDELTKAVTGTNVAFDQAKIQGDNLKTSYSKFGAAWQGMLLSLEDGNGWLMKSWKAVVDGIAWAFNEISGFIDKFKSKEALKRKEDKIAQKEAEKAAKANAEYLKQVEEEKLKNEQEKAEKSKAAAQKAAQEKEEIEAARMALEKANAEIAYNREIEIIKLTSKSKEEAEERIFELKRQTLLKSLELLKIELNAFKGSTAEKLKLQQEIAKVEGDLNSEVMQKRISENEKAGNKIATTDEVYKNRAKKREEEQFTLIKKTTEETVKTKEDEGNALLQNQQDVEDERRAIIQASQDAIISIQSSVFDFIGKGYENDLKKLEQQKEAGLITEKDYAKQKAEIEIKQAKLSKTKGVFDAIINTATAVVGMLSNPGGIAGIILSVAAGITGGLQVASILSEPLPTMPAFAEGTLNAPSMGLFGEAGRELMQTTTGKLIMADQATIFSGNEFKGAKIFSNPQTEYIMSQTAHNGFSKPDNSQMVGEIRSLKKAIEDKPVFIFDREKNVVGMQKGNHTERYINRYKYNS